MPDKHRLPQLQPFDSHNKRLAAHVHPADWKNPVPTGRYHLVVIGGGPAGLVTAAGAAGLGAKVALIERDLLGGDCLNVGCVPSKAVISAARMVGYLREAATFGVTNTTDATINFSAVMERMRTLRADIGKHDSAQRFTDLGIDVYLGEPQFTGPSTVAIGGQSLEFKRAVVATGARAATPPIPGLNQVRYLTNETVFSLTELPRRLAIIGAGPIGCELAQSFARFGAETTLIESTHGILPREDRDAAQLVEQQLVKDGVRLWCCDRDMEILPDADRIRIRVSSHDVQHDEVVDELVVAAGRRPNVEGLGLEAAGVAFDTGSGVQVNAYLQTTNPRIYAAGDVCSNLRFTHAADFMARTVIRNALFRGRAKVTDLIVPWCTYTTPELAHVGMTAQQAANQNIELDTFTQPFAGVDRAILAGETDGFVRVHVQRGTDRILGATIVAPHAGDLISEITLAMKNGIGLSRIADTIHPYPTQAEAIRKVGDLYNRTRLRGLAKKAIQLWLRWTR